MLAAPEERADSLGALSSLDAQANRLLNCAASVISGLPRPYMSSGYL
jgi:hypothetical protein